MLEDIGKKIRKAREDQSISQKDLGMALGLSDKAVSAYEASRTIPPLETLVRIAEELNKPLDYFLDSNADEYALETKLSTMEHTVSNLLNEIHKIQDFLGVPQQDSQTDTRQDSQTDTPQNTQSNHQQTPQQNPQ